MGCVIGATAGSCRIDHPSSIRNWLLYSFLPREESAYSSPFNYVLSSFKEQYCILLLAKRPA